MGSMKEMDAFNSVATEVSTASPSKQKSYFTLEEGTGAKFAKAMKEACNEQKDVQITIRLKSNSSKWREASWKAICDAFVKETFNVKPSVFILNHMDDSTICLYLIYRASVHLSTKIGHKI